MAVDRWVTLAASLLLELCAGTAYAFGTYSSQLKAALQGGNQKEIDNISSIGNIGMYTGILGGLFLDRFGAKATVTVGGLLTAIGYLLIFLCTADVIRIPRHPVYHAGEAYAQGDVVIVNGSACFAASTAIAPAHAGNSSASNTTYPVPGSSPKSWGSTTCAPWGIYAVLFAVAWQGSAWLDSAAIATNMKNFAHNRGLVIGGLKSFFGLSGSVFAQVYLGVYAASTVAHAAASSSSSSSDSLKSTLVILFGVTNSLGRMAAGSGSDAFKHRANRPACYALFLGIMVIGLVLFAATPSTAPSGCPNATSSSSSAAAASGSRALPLLLFMSIAVAILVAASVPVLRTLEPHQARKLSSDTKRSGCYTETRRVKAMYVCVITLSLFLSAASLIQHQWAKPNHAASLAMTIAMFVMMVLLLVVIAAPTKCARLASSSRSAAPPSSLDEGFQPGAQGEPAADLNESLIGGGGGGDGSNGAAAAAAAAPAVSREVLTPLQCLTRADFYLCWLAQWCGTGVGLTLLNNLGQIGEALGSSALIFVACCLCGFAYGGFWALNPTMVSELFGNKHFGANYQLLGLAPATASYAMSAGITASLYSAHTDPGCPGAQVCVGTACFLTSFLVMTGFAAFGLLLSLVLSCRTRAWYRTQLDNYKVAKV